MKKVSSLLIALILLFAYSCTKENTGGTNTGGGNTGGGSGGFTLTCTGAAVNFTNDVSPIFQSVCAQSGCHASGSTNGPGALTSYSQISSAKANIRAVILSGSMPKNSALSNAQRNSIICWIDAGALNN